jgi:hypothetical protein
VELLQHIGLGFAVALQPTNLLYCFLGVFIGTLIGVLPGIGPVGAMSLLFPITFKATPEAAIIMLAGIYYGAMYGGSTTSILVNIPGEAASVVTCLDGYQMARKGRAGPALGMCAIGSFIGGTASIIGLMLLAPPLSQFALAFGPPEYFSLMVLGLTRFHGEGAADGRVRHRARAHGSRFHQRPAATDVRPPGADRRDRHRAARDGPLRRRRGPPERRAGAQARRVRDEDQGPLAEREGLGREPVGDPARLGRGVLPRDPARRRGRDLVVPVLRAREAALETPRAFRPWRDRGRRRPGGREQSRS